MPNLVKVLLLPLLFSLVLSGCSLLPGGKEEEVITIRYWGLWEDANAINQVINEYKKIKPNVNIVYEKRSPQQYRESLQSQIGSGEGPDLFRFHNTWVPMLKDILDPVPSDIVSTSDFKKNFYPTVFFDLRNNDKKFVGVPLEIDGLALYWNEDIFKAAGINSPPSTWSELAQTAIKLTVRDPSGGIRTAGIALGDSFKC